MKAHVLIAVAGATLLATAGAAPAELPAAQVKLVLENHRFNPATSDVPAGQRIRSDALHAEKVVEPHGKAVFTVGPLTPGTAHFMGELHADTAKGELHVVSRTAP